jgi:hypothetical protein
MFCYCMRLEIFSPSKLEKGTVILATFCIKILEECKSSCIDCVGCYIHHLNLSKIQLSTDFRNSYAVWVIKTHWVNISLTRWQRGYVAGNIHH